MTKLALFDVDGTLSNDAHRRALYVPGEPSGYWAEEVMHKDTVFEEARTKVTELRGAGWQIGVLTARIELYRPATEGWLKANGFAFMSPVILRKPSQQHLRPPAFKVSVLLALRELYPFEYEEVILFDNDDEVVALVSEIVGESSVVHCKWDLDISATAN